MSTTLYGYPVTFTVDIGGREVDVSDLLSSAAHRHGYVRFFKYELKQAVEDATRFHRIEQPKPSGRSPMQGETKR